MIFTGKTLILPALSIPLFFPLIFAVDCGEDDNGGGGSSDGGKVGMFLCATMFTKRNDRHLTPNVSPMAEDVLSLKYLFTRSLSQQGGLTLRGVRKHGNLICRFGSSRKIALHGGPFTNKCFHR